MPTAAQPFGLVPVSLIGQDAGSDVPGRFQDCVAGRFYNVRLQHASAYLKQRGEDLSNKGDSLIQTADAMLAKTAQSPDKAISENSFYDRGNVAYKGEDCLVDFVTMPSYFEATS
mgnify:CR=1 FL=1